MAIKTCKDGFQYDDAMWTEEHARQISSTIKKAASVIIVMIGLVALMFILVIGAIVYNAVT